LQNDLGAARGACQSVFRTRHFLVGVTPLRRREGGAFRANGAEKNSRTPETVWKVALYRAANYPVRGFREDGELLSG
jgi:hypothetical protein